MPVFTTHTDITAPRGWRSSRGWLEKTPIPTAAEQVRTGALLLAPMVSSVKRCQGPLSSTGGCQNTTDNTPPTGSSSGAYTFELTIEVNQCIEHRGAGNQFCMFAA